MFNEQRLGGKRHEWIYKYKGKDLLPHAQRQLAEYRAQEAAARKKMAQMIQDPNVFHNDASVQQIKQDIERYGGLREQLQVYCHEFHRNPSAEFNLLLGDVIFFGLFAEEAGAAEK
jgi:hypothetical protein